MLGDLRSLESGCSVAGGGSSKPSDEHVAGVIQDCLGKLCSDFDIEVISSAPLTSFPIHFNFHSNCMAH